MIAEKIRKISVFTNEVLNKGSAKSLVKLSKPTKLKFTDLEPLNVISVIE
jgi:hypothetical protein